MIYSNTDMGNAKRFISRYGDRLRYCPQEKLWYTWAGTHWEADREGEVVRMAKSVVEGIPAEASGIDPAWAHDIHKWAKHSESLQALTAMVTMAQTEPGVSVSVERFNANTWVFNFQNGTLDMVTGKFRRHDKGDLLTFAAPFEYDPDAKSSRWEGFLSEVLVDPELRGFVQAASGYSLTSDCSMEVMFFLYGTGSNGKSTFINTMLAVMGGYAAQSDSSSWLKHKSDGARSDLVRLIGKRFVAATEAEQDREFNEELLKQVTGGEDRIVVNPKYRDEFEFKPTWKLWLSANHRPVIHGNDDAIWRRIRLIPFEVRIPEDRRDPELKYALTHDPDEWAGVFNWAYAGFKAWYVRNALPAPVCVKAATSAYRREQDIVGQFLDECCVYHPDAKVSKADIYAAFEKYCQANGERNYPRNRTFGNELVSRSESMVWDRKYQGAHHWFGVGLSQRVVLKPTSYAEGG